MPPKKDRKRQSSNLNNNENNTSANGSGYYLSYRENVAEIDDSTNAIHEKLTVIVKKRSRGEAIAAPVIDENDKKRPKGSFKNMKPFTTSDLNAYSRNLAHTGSSQYTVEVSWYIDFVISKQNCKIANYSINKLFFSLCHKTGKKNGCPSCNYTALGKEESLCKY